MAYEMNPGQFSLFKNERKEKDTHPDYTGKIMLEDGEHYLDAWLKEGKKGKFMSGKIGNRVQQRQNNETPSDPYDW